MDRFDADKLNRFVFALGIGALAIGYGCATPTVTACPPIVAYDQQTMTSAAAELAALPDGSTLAAMMGDYKRERAELRACAGK